MAALTEVRVPDIGDFTDVPVIEILVAPGDAVDVDAPLIVLESDKATMEVPAPLAGVVRDIAVSVGDGVSKGDLILSVEASGNGAAPSGDGAGPAEPQVSAARPAAEEPPSTAAPEPASAAAPSPPAPTAPPAAPEVRGPTFAGPSARRLARELGVDVATLTGSGRGGRVTTDDVRAAAAGAPAPAPAAAPAGLPPWPQVDFARFGPVEVVELSRIARLSGPALARNWALIPHVTQHDLADVTELEAFRKEVNAAHADDGVKVTMVSLVLKACAAALKAHPRVNSSLDGQRLVLKGYYNLGVAVDTPEGLVVPVIRDVDRKGLLDLARELTEVSGRARAGRLTRDDIEGGTFSVSSLGGIGGTHFTPIINAPEVAILGVSRMSTQPVWADGEFRPRLMLPLSLSYDHRVIDGAEGARFITTLAGMLGDLRRTLL